MISNHSNIVPAEEQVVLTLSGDIYRINQKEYNARERNLSFFLYYLITLMLLANTYNIYLLIPTQLRLVLIYAVIAHMPIGFFLWRERKYMIPVIINYIILVLNLATDVAVPPEKVFIVGAAFGIAFVINMVMLDEKRAIGIVLLILVQAILVQLKASRTIVEEWKLVLMPMTAVEVCLAFGLVIILVSVVLEICSGMQEASRLQSFNVGIKLMMTSTHAIQFALPISIVYSENKLISILIVVAIEVHHLAIILLIVLRKEHFICCFTTLAKDSASLFQRNEQVSAMEKTIQRVSSHWFALEAKSTMNPESHEEILPYKQECLICLSDAACMVWSPCGHLSTCEKCAEYLIKNKKYGCLLCKIQAKKLIKIKIQSSNFDREYQVEREFTIIRSGDLY